MNTRLTKPWKIVISLDLSQHAELRDVHLLLLLLLLLLCLSNEEDEMGRACGTYDRRNKKHAGMCGKPERIRPLGRPRRRWKDCIQIILNEWNETLWTEFIWFIQSNGLRT
jgi:hypothetical protein